MRNKNKVTNILFIVLSLAFVLGIGFILFKKPSYSPTETVIDPTPVVPVTPTPVVSGNSADLVSFSLTPGAHVSGVVAITGSLKGAYFFEATARGMLLDASKNVVKSFPITATGEWMTSDAVAFSASVDTTGVAAGAGYIRLENDNPSGDPSLAKHVDIPVVFN